MSATSTRQIGITYSGDATGSNFLTALSNTSSPAEVQPVALVSGANTITVPAGATGVSVLKPAGNSTTMTFKGVTGDTGVALHLTDPDSFSLASSVTSFVLTAGGNVTVRLFWT